MRIGYFADGPWSHNALKKILMDSAFSVEFICARSDNPDQILKDLAFNENIKFLVNQDINSEEFLAQVKEFECDIYVSMSFNQIFKSKIISQTPLGIINCHAGKLPFYRGRNILNWALINDEKDFGVTVHYVDEGIDTGDIIFQRTYPISDCDNYATLLERSYLYCADVLHKSLQMLNNGTAPRIKQTEIHPTGFYCCQRKVGDERINWHDDSRDIFNFVRAICCPGPQARTFLNGNEVKINKVEYWHDAPKYKGISGVVLGIDDEGFTVKTADSFVKILEYNSSEMKVKVGDRFE